MRKLGLALVVAVIGCGGGSGPGDTGGPGATHTPTVHPIFTNEPIEMQAGDTIETDAFALPTGSVVNFTIVDTPTGIGQDSLHVGVATEYSVAAASPVVYGEQQGVASTSGTTQPLPADSYVFLAGCHNVIDDCIFNLTLSATY